MDVAVLIVLILAAVTVVNVGFWWWLVTRLKRKYPLPEDLQSPDPREASEAEFGGYYLETRIVEDDTEAGRFVGWGMLARGNGMIVMTPRGFHFWRRGAKKPFWIPYFTMRRAEVVLSERMRIRGKMSLTVDWELAGYRLRSVFMVSGGVSATVRVGQWLQARIP